MAKQEKVPQVRFEGFTDPWEQRKLEDVVQENLKPVPTPSGEYTRLGIRSHAKGTFHEKVPVGKALDVDTMYEVEADNLIVNITFAWEHAVAITSDKDAGKLVSHRFPQFKFNEGFAPIFFKYAILDPEFKHKLGLASPGGAGRNRVLKKSEMLDIAFRFPSSIVEQQDIGELLSQLDSLITLHQRKHEKLSIFKKSMLEKMFPKDGADVPEVRFEGFTDPWEQREFAELVSRVSTVGGAESSLPRVEYEDIVSGQGQLNKDIYGKKSSKSGIHFEAGDVLFGKLRPYLQNWLLPDFTGIAVGDWWVLRPQDTNSEFIYALIQSPKYQMVSNLSTGTKMPRSDWSVVSKTTFAVPSDVNEQAHVGAIFKHLDNLITLHQREFEKLQNMKKALLEKMFV